MTTPPAETPPARRGYTARDNMRLFASRRVLRWLPLVFVVCFPIAWVLPDQWKTFATLPGVLILSRALVNAQRARDASPPE